MARRPDEMHAYRMLNGHGYGLELVARPGAGGKHVLRDNSKGFDLAFAGYITSYFVSAVWSHLVSVQMHEPTSNRWRIPGFTNNRRRARHAILHQQRYYSTTAYSLLSSCIRCRWAQNASSMPEMRRPLITVYIFPMIVRRQYL
jgi:hypothetical protein